jgi:uncharacterized protein (DUF736 family)
MAIIGKFTRRGKIYEGNLQTLTLYAQLTVLPVEGKAHEKSPDYRVIAQEYEIGAAWDRRTKDGKEFLSIQLDDPSLPEPIACRLMKTGVETYGLFWDRKRSKDA